MRVALSEVLGALSYALDLTEGEPPGHAVRTTAIGMRLALDDFGTGYSSLTYVRRFPIDTLKIDRSFIDGIVASSEDEAIVTAVLSMGRALGVHVVAEGVETEEQATRLRSLGCTLAQGYLFSRPISGDAARELLAGASH